MELHWIFRTAYTEKGILFDSGEFDGLEFKAHLMPYLIN